MTQELQIPKTELVVELAMVSGERRRVSLFLAEQTQHLIDLLEGPEQFLPALGISDHSATILNKRSVLWASIGLIEGRLPIEENDETLYDRRVDVQATMFGGEVLSGEVLFSPPEGKSRLTDHLNHPCHFFRIWTADSLLVVNKEQVLRLSELPQTSEEA